jgi:hypothetical protein
MCRIQPMSDMNPDPIRMHGRLFGQADMLLLRRDACNGRKSFRIWIRVSMWVPRIRIETRSNCFADSIQTGIMCHRACRARISDQAAGLLAGCSCFSDYLCSCCCPCRNVRYSRHDGCASKHNRQVWLHVADSRPWNSNWTARVSCAGNVEYDHFHTAPAHVSIALDGIT